MQSRHNFGVFGAASHFSHCTPTETSCCQHTYTHTHSRTISSSPSQSTASFRTFLTAASPPTSAHRLSTTIATMAEEISWNALVANVVEWKDRLVNNSVQSWEEMSAQRWIRIIVLVGAYMLIRPYLLAHAERSRKKREAKEAADLGLDVETELSANDFRGGKKTRKGDEGLVQRSTLR